MASTTLSAQSTALRVAGGWQAGLPQGVGVYRWADGSDYDGEWQVSFANLELSRPVYHVLLNS